jgi:O-methyltransferase
MSLYIDLVKKCLINEIYQETEPDFQGAKRGAIWPKYAMTMVGAARLNTIELAVETILRENIAGNFIETGVWRGGSCILMKAILKEHEILDRNVIVADSFAGLQPPLPTVWQDKDNTFHLHTELAVSIDEVRKNFFKFGLLDNGVEFLPGFFEDTIPSFNRPLSLLRIDCDSYNATLLVLNTLYPMVSKGGYIICDDFSWVPPARMAIEDFRYNHSIITPFIWSDASEVYWRKQ